MQENYWYKKNIVGFYLSICVLLIHISTFANYVDLCDKNVNIVLTLIKSTFTEVAVPLYFIISGATFFRNYKNSCYLYKLKKRFKSIIIPYLVWNFLHMVFSIATSYTVISKYFIGREKFIISLSNVIDSIIFYKCNPVFWFIFDLIIFMVLSPVFDIISSTKVVSMVSLFVITILILFTDIFNINAIFRADSMIFYFIGCIVGKYYFENKFSKNYEKMATIVGGGIY